jgi:hypothetical protein
LRAAAREGRHDLPDVRRRIRFVGGEIASRHDAIQKRAKFGPPQLGALAIQSPFSTAS